MGKIRSYQDLDVWQRSINVAVQIYEITKQFPTSEQYGLTNQMRRAAVSIASNIAEGHARTRREYAHFLNISRGSLAELETQMEISKRIGFLNDIDFETLVDELRIIGRQLNSLLSKIRE